MTIGLLGLSWHYDFHRHAAAALPVAEPSIAPFTEVRSTSDMTLLHMCLPRTWDRLAEVASSTTKGHGVLVCLVNTFTEHVTSDI